MIIYGLVDPRNQALRYVGKTSTALKKRLNKHITNSKYERGHRANWVRSLIKAGLRPEAFVIEVVDDDGGESERHHIAMFKSLGCDLTNGTSGGDGGSRTTEATRARMSAAQLARNYKHKAETRALMSKLRKGMKFTPEHRENMRKSRLGFRVDPAHHAKMLAGAAKARRLKRWNFEWLSDDATKAQPAKVAEVNRLMSEGLSFEEAFDRVSRG